MRTGILPPRQVTRPSGVSVRVSHTPHGEKGAGQDPQSTGALPAAGGRSVPTLRAGAHLGQPTSGPRGGGAPFAAHPLAPPSLLPLCTWADPLPRAPRGWRDREEHREPSEFLPESWKCSSSAPFPLPKSLELGRVGLEAGQRTELGRGGACIPPSRGARRAPYPLGTQPGTRGPDVPRRPQWRQGLAVGPGCRAPTRALRVGARSSFCGSFLALGAQVRRAGPLVPRKGMRASRERDEPSSTPPRRQASWGRGMGKTRTCRSPGSPELPVCTGVGGLAPFALGAAPRPCGRQQEVKLRDRKPRSGEKKGTLCKGQGRRGEGTTRPAGMAGKGT